MQIGKLLSEGSQFDIVYFFTFFLVDEGLIEDPNIIIDGPSSDRQQNAIHMAFP